MGTSRVLLSVSIAVMVATARPPAGAAARPPTATSAPAAPLARRLDIRWPVAQDHDATAWNPFGCEAWPTLFVIGRQGRVRDVHIGELHRGTPAWRRVTLLLDTLVRERG